MASIITERQLAPLLGCARAPISPADLERGGHVLLPSLPNVAYQDEGEPTADAPMTVEPPSDREAHRWRPTTQL